MKNSIEMFQKSKQDASKRKYGILKLQIVLIIQGRQYYVVYKIYG